MSSQIDVQISLAAMAEMIRFDLSNPGKETAGLLIGHEEGGIVHVDSIRVGKQTGNAVHVVISDEELMHAAIEVSERSDGKVIVGWWHTHPGLSAFLSGTDIRTQSVYQALMPKAIAIVIDDMKYMETGKLTDLDFGVFRVSDGKAVRVGYKVTDSLEIGLAATALGKVEITQPNPPKIEKYFAPSLSAKELKRLRIRAQSSSLNDDEREKIDLWLDLAEAMQTGDIKEVPLDVDSLLVSLDDSLADVHDSLTEIEEQVFNRDASRSFIAMLFGLVLEFVVLFVLI